MCSHALAALVLRASTLGQCQLQRLVCPAFGGQNSPDYMQQYPEGGLGEHTHCRNPDRELRPWCFYRQKSGAISWAYCDCNYGAARLVGGPSSNRGRLEVYFSGQWGAVCDTHWTDGDASVVCRQLGLG
ncbi:hypothetical protein NQD34_010850 [Periophthalmus magnuspinnatus]|nr:hypothetical protein NQD34_010850 [Periophthalmus magnuspinnatus]